MYTFKSYHLIIPVIFLAIISSQRGFVADQSYQHSVKTVPDNAQIILDGKSVGTTPAEIKTSKGHHTLTFKHNNFSNLTQTVHLNGPTKVRFALNSTSRSSPHKLMLLSRPTRSTIYVNDKKRGTTPTSIELPSGTHSITLRKQGYTKWSGQIDIQSDLSLNPKLQPSIGVKATEPEENTVEPKLNNPPQKSPDPTHKKKKTSQSQSTKRQKPSNRSASNEQSDNSPKLDDRSSLRLSQNERSTDDNLDVLIPVDSENSSRDDSRNQSRSKSISAMEKMSENPDTYNLYLRSDPSQATVKIDGTPRGQTPTNLTVTAGTHALTLNHMSKNSVQRQLHVNRDMVYVDNLTNNSAPKIHTVTVESDPSSATVRINDDISGKTPWKIDMTEETISLQVTKTGFSRWEANIPINRNRTVQAQLTNIKSISKHNQSNTTSDSIQLRVKSTPSNATVYRNQKRLGRTPLQTQIISGKSRITVSRNGYERWSQKRSFSNNPTLDVQLKKKKSTLSFKKLGNDHMIRLDDKSWKSIEPSDTITVPSGKHKIAIGNPDEISYDTTVTLKPGDHRTIALESSSKHHARDFPKTRDVFFEITKKSLTGIVDQFGIEPGDRVIVAPRSKNSGNALVEDVLTTIINKRAGIVVDPDALSHSYKAPSSRRSPQKLTASRNTTAEYLLNYRVIGMDVNYENSSSTHTEKWINRHFSLEIMFRLLMANSGEVLTTKRLQHSTQDRIPRSLKEKLDKSY